MKYQIALDIGATKILGASMLNKKIIKKIKRPTRSKLKRAEVVKNIIKVARELIVPNSKLIKIGIGIAGQVDYKKGIVLSTANFGKDFKNVRLAQLLKTEFKVPVQIDNDAKCFLQAEMKFGGGRGYQDVVGLTFGTGIGGAIAMNGSLWRGANNTAGEVGHMKISGQWIGQVPICGCGQKYCWESVASGRAWQKLYKKYSQKKADEIIIYNIVTGLLNLCYLLNPEVIILGGGLMEHHNLIEKIKKEFNSRTNWSWFKKTKITPAKLKDEAILFGSVL